MTMVPSQSRYFQKAICYGGCGAETLGLVMNRVEGYDQFNHSTESGLRSELLAAPMAEDESRTNSDLNDGNSSSKEANDREKDEEWLQLTVGSSSGQKDEPGTRRNSSLVELDLLPVGRSKLPLEQDQAGPSLISPHLLHFPEFKSPVWPISNTNSIASSSNFIPPPSMYFSNSSSFPHQEINWAFRPFPLKVGSISSSASYSSSSSSSFLQMGPYFSGPPLIQLQTSPSSDFRVIDPPRRPHSGIWFTLQASEYQSREPFLPQISKSYLRIKDGRMTVRLVMKYLANKLRLESESEVEITCKGQKLEPSLTLQHVRDSVWSPGNAVVLSPNSSSSSDHVMVLHYGRGLLRTE